MGHSTPFPESFIAPAMIAAPDKIRYPRAAALAVARELCEALKPHCERLIVAGSLRRRKAMVGDVEILYIPRLERVQRAATLELFGQFSAPAEFINCADRALEELRVKAVILQRKNVNGSIMWGDKNKFATHTASGIPVDFFSASEANWFNYLVCRTGSADNNTAICLATQAKGWKWNPYGAGFTDQENNLVPVRSEPDVFALAGLPYKEPERR